MSPQGAASFCGNRQPVNEAPRADAINDNLATGRIEVRLRHPDGDGVGAAHAKDIARAQHPTGRLSAVPAELHDGQDRHKLLAAWLRGEG